MRADICSKTASPAFPAPFDPRYVFGVTCTWNGPIQDVNYRFLPYATVPTPSCPHCGSMLMEVECEEVFWAHVKSHGRSAPDYEPMMLWGKGKCFQDADTLLNAYRQAMEE